VSVRARRLKAIPPRKAALEHARQLSETLNVHRP
jgi:hypothetical protein